MEGATGAGLRTQLGAALDEMSAAVDSCRGLDALTTTDRKAVNAAMDDLMCEHERLKLSHQRMLERAQAAQAGRP